MIQSYKYATISLNLTQGGKIIKTRLCEKYLKDNDELLFEVYASGKLNKTKHIPTILLNVLTIILSEGFLSVEHNYIIGLGKSNIYILDLGIDILIHKMKVKKVHILDRKSIENVTVDRIERRCEYKITIQTQQDKRIYYTGLGDIKQSQIEILSQLPQNTK